MRNFKLKEKIKKYNIKPKICINCGKNIPYEKKRNKFCSSSCSAIFNNHNRVVSDKTKEKISSTLKDKGKNKHKICIQCGKEFVSKKEKQKYCSVECSQGEKHYMSVSESTIGKYKGTIKSIMDVSSRTTTKIFKRLDIGCCLCNWKESSCDIHHINGKKIENCNDHNNLTYICPNCHRLVHNGKIDKNKLIPLNKILPDNWMESYYG